MAAATTSSARWLGRYTLHQEFASGGMGAVHFGLVHAQGGFCRVVAIKAMRSSEDVGAARKVMLLDEARLAGRIRHPNVVPVLDVIAEEDNLYLVMEYVHGLPLSSLLERSRARGAIVPRGVLVAVLCDALRGLHAAHEAVNRDGEPLGLVHRDVSPQNILVGVDGLSRIVDFGVAKAKGRLQATTKGELKGKLAYMAPEQIQGGDVDRRADIFAAGVVLWEGLAGQRLHEGSEEARVLGRVLFETFPPPSSVTGAPEPLEEVAMKAIAKGPEQRFGTALEMVDAMVCLVRPAPPAEVTAWVESLAERDLVERAIILRELEAEAERESLLPENSPSPAPAAPATSPELQGGNATAYGIHAPIVRGGGYGRMAVATAAVALVIVGLALFGFMWRGPSDQSGVPPPAVASRPSVPIVEPIATQTGSAEAFDAPGGHDEPVASAPLAQTATASRQTRRPPSPVRSQPSGSVDLPSSGAADCDPPYTLDEQGNRKYKLNCL